MTNKILKNDEKNYEKNKTVEKKTAANKSFEINCPRTKIEDFFKQKTWNTAQPNN